MFLFLCLKDLGFNETGNSSVVTDLRRTIREAYVDFVANATVDSVDSLDQTNSVITSLLASPSELTVNSQVSNTHLIVSFT